MVNTHRTSFGVGVPRHDRYGSFVLRILTLTNRDDGFDDDVDVDLDFIDERAMTYQMGATSSTTSVATGQYGSGALVYAVKQAQ